MVFRTVGESQSMTLGAEGSRSFVFFFSQHQRGVLEKRVRGLDWKQLTFLVPLQLVLSSKSLKRWGGGESSLEEAES